MTSIKQQTIKSAKWNFIDRVAGQGIQFLLGIVIARFLLPSDYGAIGMLGFLNGAMSSATQRFMSYAEGQGNQEKKIGVFNVSIVIFLFQFCNINRCIYHTVFHSSLGCCFFQNTNTLLRNESAVHYANYQCDNGCSSGNAQHQT